MIPILTPEQMAEVDAAAPEPVEVLIERAGAAVARAAVEMMGGCYGRRVVVLAGPGNNGADGRAAAHRLRRRGVRVVEVPVKGAPACLPVADLYIDAAFGTGLSRPFAAPDRAAPDAPVLAVDIPSGLDGLTGEVLGGPVWTAQRTVTFVALKPGLLFGAGSAACGEVTVADIGLAVGDAAEQCALVTDDDVEELPVGSGATHKWHAAALVVAGSPGMGGAAALTCEAAMRSGARMVHLSSLAEVWEGMPVEIVRSEPPLTVDPGRFAVCAVGPGLGTDASAAARLAEALALDLPTVVDADGLRLLHNPAVAEVLDRRRRRAIPLVLTPHDGEFEALTSRRPGPDRIAVAREAAVDLQAVVLLKGGPTVVAAPDGRARVVCSGDSRLATAGTGDVLTGMIAGRLAAVGSERLLDRVAHAAHLHGRAASSDNPAGAMTVGVGASESTKPRLVASDLLVSLRGGEHSRRASPTVALVSPAAIEANVRRLAEAAGDAALCAVIKADGYGHGLPVAARAAVAAGARWLAVATVDEALKALATVDAEVSVLILSELTPQQAAEAARECPDRVRFTVASVGGVEALAAAAGPQRAVHLMIDTGMHRMGATASDLEAVAAALRAAAPRLRVEAVWTHFAVADEPDDPFTTEQLSRFEVALAQLRDLGVDAPMTHAANSAGLLAHPRSRMDLVRAGIACYGVSPSPEVAEHIDLEPAMSLISRVTGVRTVGASESVSYGRHWYAERDSLVGTVAIGYADGIRRDSGACGVDVLLRGHRCPIVGAVTMDQLMILLPEPIAHQVTPGDDVVLIGRQGDEEVTATEVAHRLGTIPYEVLTGIGSRVPRVLV